MHDHEIKHEPTPWLEESGVERLAHLTSTAPHAKQKRTPEPVRINYTRHARKACLLRIRQRASMWRRISRALKNGLRLGLSAVITAGRAMTTGLVLAYRRRAMTHQLAALDDRTLKDIGLSRGQIPAVVEEHIRRDDS